LGFTPLVQAGGADASGVERVPFVPAGAEPFVVFARRPTAQRAAAGPHDRTGKQFYLPPNFCGNIAGSVAVCTSLMSELYTQMEKLPTPFRHDHVRDAIQEAQFREFCNQAKCKLKTTLCITVGEWKGQYLAQWLREEGKSILRSIELDAQLTVGGMVQDDKGEWGPVCWKHIVMIRLSCGTSLLSVRAWMPRMQP
jgi:hypothetical protein